MALINPETPVYNTIIFYILVICILLIIKPEFMYCDKTNKFKPFGLDKDKTIFCFPTISIGSVIILYLFFVSIEILHNHLS